MRQCPHAHARCRRGASGHLAPLGVAGGGGRAGRRRRRAGALSRHAETDRSGALRSDCHGWNQVSLLPPVRAVLFDKDGTLFDFNATWMPLYLETANEVAGGDKALALELLVESGYD